MTSVKLRRVGNPGDARRLMALQHRHAELHMSRLAHRRSTEVALCVGRDESGRLYAYVCCNARATTQVWRIARGRCYTAEDELSFECS